jgi:hypothetical protein
MARRSEGFARDMGSYQQIVFANGELLINVSFLTEPQIRLKLDSFVGKGNFLSDSAIGMEFEISNRFYNQQDTTWFINPTVFRVPRSDIHGTSEVFTGRTGGPGALFF